MGVSFAIPIDVAMDVADQLRTEGRVSRGWLGVMIQEVNRDLAESFGLDRPHGALISRVFDDTPAAAGRLAWLETSSPSSTGRKPSNVLRSCHTMSGQVRAGAMADVELVRDGREDETAISRSASWPTWVLTGRDPTIAQSGAGNLGLVVSELAENELSRLQISAGVRVRCVSSGAAEDAGMRSGDVVMRLNNLARWRHRCRTYRDCRRAHPGKPACPGAGAAQWQSRVSGASGYP